MRIESLLKAPSLWTRPPRLMISLINKTPAVDSSPVEFYLTFWSKLGPLLIEVFNESVSDGELSNSMKARIMHLVFKKGDTKSLKTWRPISLLNVDYKMYIIIYNNTLY